MFWKRNRKQRILLAGPTILYLPVYLAWINSNETVKEQITFWTPDTAEMRKSDGDPLMDEYYEDFDRPAHERNVLLCVGDPLRDAGKHLSRWEDETLPPLLAATLINQLPMKAFRLPYDGDPNRPPVYLAHRDRMSTHEIAKQINSERKEDAKILGHLHAGYEDIYVNTILDPIISGEIPQRQLPNAFLIGTDTFINSAFSLYPVEDHSLNATIRSFQMGEGGRNNFLLTGIMRGGSQNQGLREEFISRIDHECARLLDDAERSALEFFKNIKSLNRFHHANPNELCELANRMKGFYSFSRLADGGEEVRSGMIAAMRVRRDPDCGHLGIQRRCTPCAPWLPLLKPYQHAPNKAAP